MGLRSQLSQSPFASADRMAVTDRMARQVMGYPLPSAGRSQALTPCVTLSSLRRAIEITRPTFPICPGCVSVGDTVEEVKVEIREAIEFHLEGMREDEFPIPEPSSQAEYVEVREQTA